MFYQDYKSFNCSNFTDNFKAIFLQLMLYIRAMNLIKCFSMFYINTHHWNVNYLERIILIQLISLNLSRKQLWEGHANKLCKKKGELVFNNPNVTAFTDNKLYLKTAKPFFLYKGN